MRSVASTTRALPPSARYFGRFSVIVRRLAAQRLELLLHLVHARLPHALLLEEADGGGMVRDGRFGIDGALARPFLERGMDGMELFHVVPQRRERGVDDGVRDGFPAREVVV